MIIKHCFSEDGSVNINVLAALLKGPVFAYVGVVVEAVAMQEIYNKFNYKVVDEKLIPPEEGPTIEDFVINATEENMKEFSKELTDVIAQRIIKALGDTK